MITTITMTVCSFSNADSIAGSSNDEEIYTDKLVKDEGGRELVLVLSREGSLNGLEGSSLVLDTGIILLSFRAVTTCMRK